MFSCKVLLSLHVNKTDGIHKTWWFNNSYHIHYCCGYRGGSGQGSIDPPKIFEPPSLSQKFYTVMVKYMLKIRPEIKNSRLLPCLGHRERRRRSRAYTRSTLHDQKPVPSGCIHRLPANWYKLDFRFLFVLWPQRNLQRLIIRCGMLQFFFYLFIYSFGGGRGEFEPPFTKSCIRPSITSSTWCFLY